VQRSAPVMGWVACEHGVRSVMTVTLSCRSCPWCSYSCLSGPMRTDPVTFVYSPCTLKQLHSSSSRAISLRGDRLDAL